MNKELSIEQLIQEISEYAEVCFPNKDEKFQHILKKLERKYIGKTKEDE